MRSTPRLGSNRQRAGVALAQNLKAAMRGDGGRWVAVAPSGPRPRAVTATMASANMAVVWPCGPRRFVTVCLSWRLVDQSLPTTSFGVVAAERPSRAWAVPGLGGWADPR